MALINPTKSPLKRSRQPPQASIASREEYYVAYVIFIGRYVPPALRMQKDGEDLTKLTRQLKGLLNRMSEQNMTTILDSVEELYRKHRRNDVTSTLTTLIIDGISSHAMLIDSFVVLHAAFISSMHRLIGMDFAAFVVQHVVASYEQHLAHAENVASHESGPSEDLGKECSNLIILLAELYNFQVIACVLMYDLIRELLSRDLSELRVELLLKILRSSGQQLRQDDPSALKDIVTLAYSCIAKQGVNLNSRTRFMMETLMNLKSNKIKKAAAAQHQGGDAVERLKKFLSGLGKKRHVQSPEPLRVSLEDLRTAETKGKWWLVGAAWAGDPLADRQQSDLKKSSEVTESSENHSLLKLARKQGMNTDIRRSIFVILMSSEDYMDACERLSQLNLTEVQQREIVRVCLHCCSNEKSYNPYYALICQRFCQLSHSHKITLQYWFWDFLRDLGETNVGGTEVIKNLKSDEGRLEAKGISFSRMRNVAKAYGWWIAKDICSLLILKPVDFTLLKPQSRKLLKELFAQIFAATQGSSPMLSDQLDIQSRNRGVIEDTFNKATKIENLGLGLIFFLSHAFRDESGFLQWASSVAKETLQSGMDQIPRV
ncbi:armadillo-type protein [Pisolithus croceorrhizus]|nr:armadillo-type protein [Pisolithus croceorrhizus]